LVKLLFISGNFTYICGVKEYRLQDKELNQLLEPLVAIDYTSKTQSALTLFQKATLSKSGLPISILNSIASKFKLSVPMLAGIFEVSEKTLRTKLKKGESLKPFESDHALSLLQLYQEGMATFENKDNFLKWMDGEWEALNFVSPFTFLYSKSGVDFLIEELKSIRHGIFS